MKIAEPLLFEEGYKITSRKKMSFIENDSSLVVKYEQYKWTKPNFYEQPLMVFNTYQDAMNFCLKMELQGIIYKCVYVPSKIKMYRSRQPGENLDWYRHEILNQTSSYDKEKWPEGSIFADKVMLTEEVEIVMAPVMFNEQAYRLEKIY